MTDGALAACVVRASAIIVLTLQDKQVFMSLSSMGKEFNYLCHISVEKCKIISCFLK